MGITYELFIFDEFNWNYSNWQKVYTINQVKQKCPDSRLIAKSYGMLIFDIDKNSPYMFENKIVLEDKIQFRSSIDLLNIRNLDNFISFKLKI